MAEFVFGIGSGLRTTSPEILLKGIGVRLAKTAALFVGAKIFIKDKFKEEEEDATSYLGTPIFDPLLIQGGQFNELGNILGPPQPYDQLIIPTILIEVSQTKNIVTTAMQGRNGTIKEFISDGDYSITLTGVIIGRNEGNEVKDIGNVYPIDDVKKLIKICEVPDVLTLTNSFLNDVFGINEVVITDYNIPQREASRDMQPFQISMLSDISIELNELEA